MIFFFIFLPYLKGKTMTTLCCRLRLASFENFPRWKETPGLLVMRVIILPSPHSLVNKFS